MRPRVHIYLMASHRFPGEGMTAHFEAGESQVLEEGVLKGSRDPSPSGFSFSRVSAKARGQDLNTQEKPSRRWPVQSHTCSHPAWGPSSSALVQHCRKWQNLSYFTGLSGQVRFGMFKMLMRLAISSDYRVRNLLGLSGASLPSLLLLVRTCQLHLQGWENTVMLTHQIVKMCFLMNWIVAIFLYPSKSPWSKQTGCDFKIWHTQNWKHTIRMSLSLWTQWAVCHPQWKSWSLFSNFMGSHLGTNEIAEILTAWGLFFHTGIS